ncbi:cytochrome P450 [Amycolatopsis sp. CA-230715]|uniref:cytochrome P450 n=1 Tax=Amycolatopsis sp. CA-230715 TaxID=2745196 RepID=UPI001C018E27|nr:cytochrome P450 [Amycolatopsis sp. CA-230715]QWF78899.1 Mycinamicin IV hydroxylase/epoxidase [Amycolatopsis sp. CA-230715]
MSHAPAFPFPRPDSLGPPPEYARLREKSPLSRVTVWGDQSAWLVTRYDDVRAVLSDARLGVQPPGASVPGNASLMQDPPEHTRLRGLVSKAFAARQVQDLAPRVAGFAAELVDAMAAGGPRADIVGALARPLPLAVIGTYLGIPEADREEFRERADAIEDGTGALAVWERLTAYLSEVVARKRRAPGDDLLSALIALHDEDGVALSTDELVQVATSLLLGGYGTTANAISVGVLLLAPDNGFRQLRERPSLLGAAVEEVLRYQSGRTGVAVVRYAHHDVELHGERIAAGEAVLVPLDAANRDPERFPDPDRFALTRSATGHVAFGHGAHHCVGAALARVELTEAFRALARTLPGLRPVTPVARIPWTRTREELYVDQGPASIVVEW